MKTKKRNLNPRRPWTLLSTVAMLAFSHMPAPPACADHQPGVTLYEDSDFRGRRETFYRDDADLIDNVIGSRRVSSIEVPRGCTATLFTETGYEGRYVVLRQDSPHLGRTPVGNDTVSSLNVSCGVAFCAESRRVTLYEHSDFRGRGEAFCEDDPDLRNNLIGNDQASSIKVPPGCSATLYTDRYYRGWYAVLRHDSPRLRRAPVGNDTVSSLTVSCGAPHATSSAAALQTRPAVNPVCERAGAYVGTFAGDDAGLFLLLIDAQTGNVTGLAESSDADEPIELSGAMSTSRDQKTAFVSGVSSAGVTFRGRFDSPSNVSGVWNDWSASSSGTFTGQRIGHAAESTYRFTGVYGGNDFGVFALDVDSSDTGTLIAYSIPEEELLALSGRVSGPSLSVAAGDMRFTGTLNRSAGTLNGFWKNSADGSSGTFSGSGCKPK